MHYKQLATKAKRLLGGLLIGSCVLGLGAATAADEPLKVGFVYVSPVGDAGWTYQHDLGRKAIEEKFGDKIKVKYIDSVPEGAEAERVIRDLASSGNKLIFTTFIDKVKIQFGLARLERKLFEGRPAFVGPLPEKLLRLQRQHLRRRRLRQRCLGNFQLRQSLLEQDVELEINVNPNLHDREIRLDNGWVIKIGRGLDFYQRPSSWFEIGAMDMSLRKCLETKVDIFRA